MPVLPRTHPSPLTPPRPRRELRPAEPRGEAQDTPTYTLERGGRWHPQGEDYRSTWCHQQSLGGYVDVESDYWTQWMEKRLDLAGMFDTGSLIWGLHLAQALRGCLIIYQVDLLNPEHGWFRINEVKLLEIPGLLCRTEAKGSGK